MKTVLVPRPKKMDLKPVSCGANFSESLDESLAFEAYRIELNEEGVNILGGSSHALILARQTLKQLKFTLGYLPQGRIEDEPAYPWRSFHIDCSRHFFSMDELKKMVRAAALFKLNRLHWHISDDQGFRIETKVFPKLYEVGSVRQGDTFGNHHSTETYGGYYTRGEVRDFVSYCESYGIDVMPEIDLPGHTSAILAAYPELGCTGKPIPVMTGGGIFPDILCAGKEEVFSFLEALFDDLLELFPGEYVHIGGDEAPKTRWKECPLCQKRMKDLGLENMQQLQGWFLNRVAAYLKSRGKKCVAWNEASYGGNLDPDIILQFWFEDRDGQVKRHIEKGGKVILSPIASSYCDYPHAAITLENVYKLDLSPKDLGSDGVLGTECLAWAEHLRTPEDLEKKAWPRYAASAEAGWCGDNREDFADFRSRLEEIFPIFEELGIKATPPEGWDPKGAMATAELEAFKENFPPEVMQHYSTREEI